MATFSYRLDSEGLCIQYSLMAMCEIVVCKSVCLGRTSGGVINKPIIGRGSFVFWYFFHLQFGLVNMSLLKIDTPQMSTCPSF